jgi:hypothetical protein
MVSIVDEDRRKRVSLFGKQQTTDFDIHIPASTNKRIAIKNTFTTFEQTTTIESSWQSITGQAINRVSDPVNTIRNQLTDLLTLLTLLFDEEIILVTHKQ